MKTYSVKLRVFRGKKTYDKDKDDNLIVTSPNQYLHLTPYLSMEWNNWMKNAVNVGFTDGEVVEVKEIVYTEYTKRDGKEVDPFIITTYEPTEKGESISDESVINEIKAAVKTAFDTSVKVVLTPEQQEIAALKDQMAELLKTKGGESPQPKKAEAKKEVVEESTGNDDLAAWKAKYEQVFKKKPFHSWDAETLEQKIEEKLAE